MSLTVTKTRTPVQFELVEKTDDRFQKVKIRIAHTGENLNNSYFSKETLDSMKETLANIPIVAFIEKNSDDEDDFSNHRQEITVEDGDVKIRYAGHAYGFVPQDNNAHFEVYGGKEWLVCEGYLWTKFKDAMSIFDESKGVKSQSMEIQDVVGGADDLGRLVITDGRFSALCILGEDVEPAMTGSTVQLYSAKINNREVDVMMSEFAELENKRKKGGDGNVNDEEKEVKEVVEASEDLNEDTVHSEHSEATDAKGDSEVDTHTESHDDLPSADHDGDSVSDDSSHVESSDVEHNSVHTDDLDNKTSEELGGVEHHDEEQEVAHQEDAAVEGEGTEEQAESHVEEAQEEDTDLDSGVEEFATQIIGSKEFQLSHDSIRGKLYEAINTLVGEDEYAYINDVFSDYAIAQIYNYADDTKKYLNVQYSELEDSISLGEAHEVFPMFLSEKEKTRIENDRVQIEQLNAQLQELIEYRNEIEYSQKQEIVKEFEAVIGQEKVDGIEAKFSSLSIEEVKREVAFEVYEATRESNVEAFSATPATNFSTGNKNGRYGSLDVYFN